MHCPFRLHNRLYIILKFDNDANSLVKINEDGHYRWLEDHIGCPFDRLHVSVDLVI